MIADPDRRRRDLAKIHVAIKQLGIDDSTYREMLWAVGRVRSSKDLDYTGLQKVLAHLTSRGFKAVKGKRPHPGRPANIDSQDRGPLLRKIEALLTDAGREWNYANGMAKKMFHVEHCQFCEPEQLRKIVAALVIDQRRGGRKAN
jgi:phage gp16-like protein